MLVKDTVIIDGIQYWSKDFCIEFAEEYASQGMRDRYTKGMAQRL